MRYAVRIGTSWAAQGPSFSSYLVPKEKRTTHAQADAYRLAARLVVAGHADVCIVRIKPPSLYRVWWIGQLGEEYAMGKQGRWTIILENMADFSLAAAKRLARALPVPMNAKYAIRRVP